MPEPAPKPQAKDEHEERNRIAVTVMAMDILANPHLFSEADLQLAREHLAKFQGMKVGESK